MLLERSDFFLRQLTNKQDWRYVMKVLILMGSPRIHGNTAELCKYFMEELQEQNAEITYLELENMKIHPCKECYVCQDVNNEYGCNRSHQALCGQM